jgi:hypothetical protein
MPLSHIAVDFDGSLANPAILAPAIVVTLAVAVLLIVGRRILTHGHILTGMAILLSAVITASFCQDLARFAATRYYESGGVNSPGFIGGFPWWLSLIAAMAIQSFVSIGTAVLTALRAITKSQTATSRAKSAA